MPEVICNTPPLQYLFQLGELDLLRETCGRIVVPPAVVEELDVGRSLGVALPEVAGQGWIETRSPKSGRVLGLVSDLGGSDHEETPRSDRVGTMSESAGIRRLVPVLDMIDAPRFSMIASSYLSKLRMGDRDPSPELVSDLAMIALDPEARLRELERYWGTYPGEETAGPTA